MSLIAETKIIGGKESLYTEAASFGEFLDFTDSVQRTNVSREIGNESFRGSSSWEEANRIAREGWPEGLEMVRKMSENIGTVVGQYVKKVECHYDVQGSQVDVGRFLSGEPECMMAFEENTVRASGKIVKISVNVVMSCMVNKLSAFHRGAAVLALIDTLESAGMVAEVWATHSINGTKNRTSVLMIPVKKAGERPEMDRMAYIFAHASMLRRHIFAWQEGQSDPIRAELLTGGSYGYVTPHPPACIEEGEIHVQNINHMTEENWKSVESATAWVLSMLKEQGVLIEEAA